MRAEELYGPGGYTYLGNGEYVQCNDPAHPRSEYKYHPEIALTPAPHQHAHYGSTA